MADIRALTANDRPQWQPLWEGYLRFYRQRLSPAITAATFARLLDPASQPHALVAQQAGNLVGFVHYLFHSSSWSLEPVGYLEDLYVNVGNRGQGSGRALIEAVYREGDRAKAATVYWLTQEFNAEARALYDTLARRTSFIRYER